ncbi:YlqD family protein [Selenomonas sp. TAMA-11512]|uniref:YlqD family protein n=1 Tax=Selenomonas sp. TAMA-11512 TaxID=3095337 RepID=UPI0030869930|nr:YlqD family protein [Selenomonas sp. TAMA-11512]
MDSIQLKVPVTVKAKLTETLKDRIIKELEDGLAKVELELQQINIEEKRVVAEEAQKDLQRAQAARQHYGMEKQRRLDYKEQAEQKLEETKKLAIGAEIVQGTLEHVAEVKVGDDMRELMNVEILVEDDKIVAIRS